MNKFIVAIAMTSIAGICSPLMAEAAESANVATKNNAATQYFLDHIAGNLELTNNYAFRGLSQTKEEPAVQGGLAFTFDSKIYLSVWGSNVNFMSLAGQQVTLETDETIGYANTIKDFNYDLHLVRYAYPRASTASYNEVIGSLGYKFLTFLMGYSSNVFNSHGSGTYSNLNAHFDIPAKYAYFNNVTLSGGVGHYNLNPAAGTSYDDYNIQIAKGIGDKNQYVISFQWVDTNHKNPPYDNNQYIGTLTANF